MMKKARTLVSINLINAGSTGSIMMQVAALAKTKGYDTYQIYPGHSRGNSAVPGDIQICSALWNKIYQRICRYSGFNGCSAFFATIRVLRKLKKISPSVIQLHNLHHSYINLPLLFRFIKKHNIPVVWTLHDCWAFTGHCPHFLYEGCDKWKTQCHHCPLYKQYPESAFDDSKRMYKLKKKWFCGVQNMTIVTPSQWLADLVKQSFLKEYPVEVIHNGIDLSVFRPTPSDIREKYGISADSKLLLAVSFGWGEKKGVDVIISLARDLPENDRIVMVGTDTLTDALLPKNIISVHRTNNQQELSQLYTAADLFVMPSREETYPTVIMESFACGTPVILYDAGGGKEIITEQTGKAVTCDDYKSLYDGILEICKESTYSREECLTHAENFDKNVTYSQYLALYNSIIGENDFC